MISLGQVISLLGVLFCWHELADGYSSAKYLLIATCVLGWASTVKPKRGLLSVVSIIYMVALTFFALVAFKQVSFIGKKLAYFSGVFPSFLVFACYHYSIGDKWEKIANAFILGCGIASVLAISQPFGLYAPNGDYFHGRAYALIGSPVFLSGVLGMAIPLCLGRGRLYMVIPLLVTGILFTQSRSGLLAAAIGVLGYYFARGIVGAKGFAALCVIALCLTVGMFSGLRNTSASDRGRYQMLRIAAIAVSDNPIFGIGPERFAWAIQQYRDKEFDEATSPLWSNSHSHNHLLEALISGGPIFLVVHLLLIGTVGLFLYRYGSPSVFGSAMALGAFGMMQPTPLLIKCVLACLCGSQDHINEEFPREYPKAPFIALAAVTFLAALSTVVMSKIYKTGLEVGSGNIVISAYKYQPSAMGEQ